SRSLGRPACAGALSADILAPLLAANAPRVLFLLHLEFGLIGGRARGLAVRPLGRRAGEAGITLGAPALLAPRSIIRHAFVGGMLGVELDDRLHLGKHVVREPAERFVAVAEILYRRHFPLAFAVRHQMLVAAARLERAAA